MKIVKEEIQITVICLKVSRHFSHPRKGIKRIVIFPTGKLKKFFGYIHRRFSEVSRRPAPREIDEALDLEPKTWKL